MSANASSAASDPSVIEGPHTSPSATGPHTASTNPVGARHDSPSSSTGPRTEEGKAIASQNALKHGLCSSKLILPGEDQSAFDALRHDLIAEYQPTNTTEALLVDQFAIDAWRLQRARRVEIRVMEESPDLNLDQLNKLARYQTSIERSYHRTLTALQKILAERRKQQKETGLLADRAYDQAFEDAVESLIAPPPGWDNHFVSQKPIRHQDELAGLS